jgi:DNA segregation ATPase FtsK/SpoIIIE, S-DNA-T family
MDFSREPRLPAPLVAEGDITVEAPPEVPKAVPANPIARLMPVAMLVATGGMMALYFTSGTATTRGPMFMFFPVMMLASVLGSLAYGTRGANHTTQLNEDRRDYLGYLDALDQTAVKTAADQHRSRDWVHPDPEALWTLPGGRRMWERRSDDPDFCHIRVGRADQPLSTRLVAPDLGPIDGRDPVTSTAVQRLLRRRSLVADVPVAVPLRSFSAVTVDGDTAGARALLNAMVCQLAVLHSPEDVRIAVVVSPTSEADWEWLKWLPHHQHRCLTDALGPARMTYRSLGEATIGCRPPDDGESPHTVIIVDDGSAPVIEQPFTAGPRLQLRLDGDTSPDSLTPAQASVCARRLAPYRPISHDVVRHSSTAIAWLDLMSLDDPASIDPGRQWRERQGRQRLRVPIGVSEHGDPVELDIKEAARNGMGPHGLCVGATGSGKSEFLRTLILGMIAAHPPEALNLVLVDFKGGATFLGLDRVRHVSAIITNLADEAHLVARMQDALAGEMNRRQELLRAAGHFANVADYEHARSQGLTAPPLPALFIVVDEFSELLSQHPDFAELFVAIGRLGRSLGMHLLLASQRLDEGRLRGLETHLSYRICLKTFSASESRAVLGVPDAYHLSSSPGAAYLKTASGELVRFQTAFVSAQHERPSTAQRPDAPATPRVFTAAAAGRVIVRREHGHEVGTRTRTLMDIVLDRLAGHGTPAHPVWLPPLKESPALDDLIHGTGVDHPLSVPIGLVDCPYDQRRDVLTVDLAGAAGHVAIVGAPQSGKSTALRTLVMAVAATHDPSAAQFYCLDFGGGALSSLRHLPHVGSVAGRSDVDLCRRTVAEMESIVRARDVRFRRLGIDSMPVYRQLRSAGDSAVTDDPHGDVFLIIDGWATLRQDFDNLEPAVIAIAAQGLSFGVHVIVIASRWAEIRPALKDQIGTRIELRLGDPADSEMDRRRARQLSHISPGRGITRDGKEMLIALPRLDGEPTTAGLAEAIAAGAGLLRDRWNGRCAPPIELLPLQVAPGAVAAVRAAHTATQIAVGLGERELQPVVLDFADQSHLVVLGEAECGKTSALRLLCREIARTNTADSVQIEIVDFRRTLLGVVESAHLGGYAISASGLTARVPVLLERLQARMPGENVTQQQLRTRSWWSGPEIYLVIDDYDLVAGATGNPLTPLVDYLPHAKDIGLHVVVARRSGGAARAMFDPVLARLRDLGCMGLMMSASPDEGILLGSVRPSAQPPGRGTLITRGHPDQLIQMAWTEPP